MSGPKTLEAKIREYIRIHEEAGQTTPPIYLNDEELQHLMGRAHYQARIAEHPDKYGYMGVMYGVEVFRERGGGAVPKNTASAAPAPKSVFRREDLIRMRVEDPDKYKAMNAEIMKAYQEGRVI